MDRKTTSGYKDEVRNKLLNAEKYFPTKGYEQARLILIETHSSLIQKFIKLYGDMLPVLPPDEAKTHIPFLEEVSSKMSKL